MHMHGIFVSYFMEFDRNSIVEFGSKVASSVNTLILTPNKRNSRVCYTLDLLKSLGLKCLIIYP